MKTWKAIVWFLVLLIVVPQVIFGIAQLLLGVYIPDWAMNNMILNIFITNNIAAGLSIYLYYKANKVSDISEWKKKAQELISKIGEKEVDIPKPE